MHYDIHGHTSDGHTLFNTATTLDKAIALSVQMRTVQREFWRAKAVKLRIQERVPMPTTQH
jgi:hypothetical protein